jgi:hypothetical protein
MADEPSHPLLQLSEDDLNMVAALVLASGSIKDLAASYGVSYPTMRHRLDGLIERLRQRVAGCRTDPLGDYLAALIGKGQITGDAARRIRRLHQEAMNSAGREPAEGG